MSDRTDIQIRRLGEELCKVADERFAYQHALRLVLLELEYTALEVEHLLTLAKDTKFEIVLTSVRAQLVALNLI